MIETSTGLLEVIIIVIISLVVFWILMWNMERSDDRGEQE